MKPSKNLSSKSDPTNHAPGKRMGYFRHRRQKGGTSNMNTGKILHLPFMLGKRAVTGTGVVKVILHYSVLKKYFSEHL